jgi:hypothetical protein
VTEIRRVDRRRGKPEAEIEMIVTEQYGRNTLPLQKLRHACKQELDIQFYKHQMLSFPDGGGHKRVLESVDEKCSLSVLRESF